MRNRIKEILVMISMLRLIPHYLLWGFINRRTIDADIDEWAKWKSINGSRYWIFATLMLWHKQFRNVFYLRIGLYRYGIKWLCKPLSTCYINTKNIGPGLKIQHGFSSIIAAEKIGSCAHIFQQVTIGFKGDKQPILGDNVMVCAGAKILGGITVGNNVIIGANAVVVKNVPDNVVVGGIPAKILKSNL